MPKADSQDPGVAPQGAAGGVHNLDLLLDVKVPISVEVGGARLSLHELLDLAPGRIVRLDKRADEPVDLYVHGKLIARGEVVMVDDCYGLRITRIVEPVERIRSSVP